MASVFSTATCLCKVFSKRSLDWNFETNGKVNVSCSSSKSLRVLYQLAPLQVLTSRHSIHSSIHKGARNPVCPRASSSSQMQHTEDLPAGKNVQDQSAATQSSVDNKKGLGRRSAVLLGLTAGASTLGGGLLEEQAAHASSFIKAPPGFRAYVDRLDGYAFFYPNEWIQVRGAGADVFFRDPSNLDENVSVDISSPTTSKFKDLSDLGSPEEAGQQALKQYLNEFMSTRLGVRRDSQLLSTSTLTGVDGREFYEVRVNVKSYANNNQLAINPEERVAQLEWDRVYLTLLGVENNRLYAMRLQVPSSMLETEERQLRDIMSSFQLLTL
eukprot:jgi/Mesen1/1603/ME000134S00727